MRDTAKTVPGRRLWPRGLNARDFCHGHADFLELSEIASQYVGHGLVMARAIAAGRSGCQHDRLGERVLPRPRQARRPLNPAAAMCFSRRLPDYDFDHLTTGSARPNGELIAMKPRFGLPGRPRLDEKTFTSPASCTLRLHPSCMGKRGLTLNNGATDADGR